MKAFKRSGARWFARSSAELIAEWREAPVVGELIALSIEHCILEPVGDELHAKPVRYTVDPALVQSWGVAVPRCREETDPLRAVVRCELHAQHSGEHANGRLRWDRSEPPWAELCGSKAERYRQGFFDLLVQRTHGINMAEDDRRSAALNALWWQLSPAEQLDFEIWWAELLRDNTRRQQGRGILRAIP